MKKNVQWGLVALFILICVNTALTSCSDDDDGVEPPAKEHTEAVKQLIRLLDGNAEVKALLEKSIAKAAEVNPDRRYNPAQTLPEFYDFVDWNVRQLPWDVMVHQAPNDYGQSLYGRADQGVGRLRTGGHDAHRHVADMLVQLD